MKKIVGLLALAALSALALPAGAEAPSQAAPATAALTGPQVGMPAPAFSLRTLDGKTVGLDSFRGKTLVVNVWATWCPPCRLEMPDLLKSYASLHKNDVAFLGVDTTELAPIVRAYVVAKSVPYAQAIDSDKTFEKAYDIQYFPTTFVIDPQGVLRARYIDVIASAQLVQFVDAARAGHNAVVASALQQKIDALLSATTVADVGDTAGIVASAKKADDAISKAEDMLNDSDASKGTATDLLRTRVEEAALRDKAIAALASVAANPADRALLSRMQGDAASNREQWSEALGDYHAALALDPKNEDAWSGLALAAARLEQYDDAVKADEQIVALEPTSVQVLVDLGLAYAKDNRYPDAYATFDKATALGKQQVDANPGKAANVRVLSWTYLYEGRTYTKGGDADHARAAFLNAMAWADKLPADDSRHDMYLEEDQEAIVALDLTNPGQTGVSLAPWTGADLPGSTPNTLKYRLVVAGAPGKTLALHAADVPKGWVASFCSDRVCSPFKLSLTVPASGVKVIEFQLVPPDAKAKAPSVRVVATDGSSTVSAAT